MVVYPIEFSVQELIKLWRAVARAIEFSRTPWSEQLAEFRRKGFAAALATMAAQGTEKIK